MITIYFPTKEIVKYNFDKPQVEYILPDKVRDISIFTDKRDIMFHLKWTLHGYKTPFQNSIFDRS